MRFINDNKGFSTSHCPGAQKPNGRSSLSARKIVRRNGRRNGQVSGRDKTAVRGSKFEVFRASLNWDRFIRNCEFVDAIRVYTQFSGMSDIALSAESFKGWLAQTANRKAYPLLAKFMLTGAFETASIGD